MIDSKKLIAEIKKTFNVLGIHVPGDDEPNFLGNDIQVLFDMYDQFQVTEELYKQLDDEGKLALREYIEKQK